MTRIGLIVLCAIASVYSSNSLAANLFLKDDTEFLESQLREDREKQAAMERAGMSYRTRQLMIEKKELVDSRVDVMKLTSSIDARLAEIEAVEASMKNTTMLSRTRYQWTRVSDSRGAGFLDEKSRLIWFDANDWYRTFTAREAQSVCVSGTRLPTKNEVLDAASRGFDSLFPAAVSGSYWTSSIANTRISLCGKPGQLREVYWFKDSQFQRFDLGAGYDVPGCREDGNHVMCVGNQM